MEHAQVIISILTLLASLAIAIKLFLFTEPKNVTLITNVGGTDNSSDVKEDNPDPVPANIPAVTVRDEQLSKAPIVQVVCGSRTKKRNAKEIAELEQKVLALSKVGLTTKQVSVALFGDRSPADRACVSNTRVVLRRKGMLPKWPHKAKEENK